MCLGICSVTNGRIPPSSQQVMSLTIGDATSIADSHAKGRNVVETLAIPPSPKHPSALLTKYEQLHAIYCMTVAVSRATELTDIYEQALTCLESAVAANRTSILLFDADGVMRFKAWHGLSPMYREAVEGHSPWPANAKNPQPVTIPDLRSADLGNLQPVINREGIAALAFIPLVFQEKLLGKFMLYFNEPHDFTDEELQIAQTIANQIAFSIVRQKSEDDLKQANAAKSAFLATMSHELRTPLNAILGYSDLLNLGVNGGLNAAQSGHVDRIRASACHLINVIDEILTFARAEAGKEKLDVSSMDLVSLIAETASMIEPIANEKALAVNVNLRGSLGVIRTDVRKLRQILLNLLSNAVKFTDRGSISLEVEREKGQVRFTIVDTGPGIAPDQQTRIFEPFWQAETGSTRRAGGTGLGLTVTAQLVELLGGRISVESQVGMGARFIVELPDPPPTA